ncbi:MAG: hypothetical protein M3430_03620 [Acidobacteriota bacterium]|nr:hypothetical protein [Acidobacteriota bacterium]
MNQSVVSIAVNITESVVRKRFGIAADFIFITLFVAVRRMVRERPSSLVERGFVTNEIRLMGATLTAGQSPPAASATSVPGCRATDGDAMTPTVTAAAVAPLMLPRNLRLVSEDWFDLSSLSDMSFSSLR